ncbi:SIMPL domain-containing protein [Abditibacterium utsteinense]|nr:SIMPL domain-containing protein [Abditibacterium utsteinense]
MPNFGGGMGGSAIREEFANNPAQNERNKRQVNYQGGYGEPGSTFIDASVLMNVKADEYVAVFAITHQEKTASEADAKMNATVAAFKDALKKMGVKDIDTFVDFVLQNRVFTFISTLKMNGPKKNFLVSKSKRMFQSTSRTKFCSTKWLQAPRNWESMIWSKSIM